MPQAGLFSAVTSAFIIEINSELKSDPNDQTAALLRVLIYKIDNTTFGNDVPALPQWTGPPRMAVQVQAILFASLAASLFSAFLAMLGKQWLNRYASIDVRGSAIERSQNRQRKLDGIVSWYFDHVMESLPLMLQGALLLLGCALSRYLWETNTTIASVVLGVTSFGVLFYLFIIVAGAVSVSCPYQTPGARLFRLVLNILRLILDILCGIPHILRRFSSILRGIVHTLNMLQQGFFRCVEKYVEISLCRKLLIRAWDRLRATCDSPVNVVISLLWALLLPIGLLADICLFACLCYFGLPKAYQYAASTHRDIHGEDDQSEQEFESPTGVLERKPEPQTGVLDLHCILWTLRTSLEGPVRLSVLNYLSTTTLADFDPTIVVECFDVLVGCVKATNGNMAITQGSEQLAKASALCCLHTLSHLTVTDPTSRVLKDVFQRYTRSFHFTTEFGGLPFPHTLGVIHNISYPQRVLWGYPLIRSSATEWAEPRGRRQIYRWRIQWEDYKPSGKEHIIVAHALSKFAWFENQKRGGEKVPRWILRFVLHSLSKDPSPPTPVVASCLLIIAIDLGCSIPETMVLDDRYVHN